MRFTCDVCGKSWLTLSDTLTRCSLCAKSERVWRDKIASEIREAIDAGSEINAEGAYLIAKR